ncbi:Fatty acyl-CoA reductase 1 like protein [Argiope bruennichi]|uniref:Fatty acyl-CoA reductase n=1 Tax=Argiope bruennichi TaxID=94029 RepID=A0A8T0ESW2_ARGBR|nr:Fatty acyl-CoA reductase 1 like protein [Argiope bruennichi]
MDQTNEKRDIQSVSDFFEGRSVFLTGASGFLGTVILETLLRCCPGIASVYILLRSKRGLMPAQRKEMIFEKKVLVYTSSSYSNSHDDLPIKEEVYRLPFPVQTFLSALKEQDDNKLLELTSQHKSDWPNWYSLSKCISENIFQYMASDLSVAIIRPSIVGSTWKNPIPGYLDENSVFAILNTLAAERIIKVLLGDANRKLNIIPADVVANVHLMAAWSIGTKNVFATYYTINKFLFAIGNAQMMTPQCETINMDYLNDLLHDNDRKILDNGIQTIKLDEYMKPAVQELPSPSWKKQHEIIIQYSWLISIIRYIVLIISDLSSKMKPSIDVFHDAIPWQATAPGIMLNIKDELLAAIQSPVINYQRSPKELTKEAACMICVIFFFVLLAVLGSSITVYECFCKNNKKMSRYEDGDKNIKEVKKKGDGNKYLKRNVWLEGCAYFLKIFCIVKNGSKILRTTSSENQIGCIHGLRFIANAWLILLHTSMAYISTIKDMKEVKQLFELRVSQLMLGGIFSVDIFFVIR